MGQRCEKSRPRRVDLRRFGDVFGGNVRCVHRMCSPCALIAVIATPLPTPNGLSPSRKPLLTVSTVAHSPAPSHRALIILTAPRTSLKRISCSPLVQGLDGRAFFDRALRALGKLSWHLAVQV